MQCDDPPGCEAYPPGLFPDFDCRRAASEAWEGQIDWDSWRRVFEERPPAAWGDGDGAAYFGAYMDSDDWAMERHWAECPLGALNAAMYLYSASVLQGDPSSAARYAADVARGLRSFPLRILLGSSWPLFALLSGDRLRELRPDVSGDPGRNCGGVEKPALRWGQFQAAFYGEERKEWSANTMRYVLSWQMSYIPELLEEECPLGVLTLNTIQAFTCATSESSCFRAFIQKVEAWIAASPDFVDVLAHSRWPISLVLNHMSHSTRHRYQLDFSEEELVGGWRTLALLPPSGLPAPALSGAARRASSAEARFPAHLGALGRWAALLSSGGGRSRAFRDALGALPHLGPGHPEAPSLVYISMVYGPRFSRHIGRFCARARALGAPGERLLLFALDGEALASLGRVHVSFGEDHRGASLILWREAAHGAENSTGNGRPSDGQRPTASACGRTGSAVSAARRPS
ncbi:unnamed protein product [Prorocentrum cordatum]|uniref:Protein xylosyltransferase n=1 Tax=Prorocentrum cordatum TaxID=2364126 RepID=A0ABN9XBB4_9DINO|nr:unnamed protein product [Polarella glacialis]